MAQVTFDFSGTTTVVTGRRQSGIGLGHRRNHRGAGGGDVVISASRNPSQNRNRHSTGLRRPPGPRSRRAVARLRGGPGKNRWRTFFLARPAAAAPANVPVRPFTSAAISPNYRIFSRQTQKEWDTVLECQPDRIIPGVEVRRQ